MAVHPQKHYIAFKKQTRNFASVQLFNWLKVLRVYLHIDPDTIDLSPRNIRDVRQIGHFGTGDLEVTISSTTDIEAAASLFKASYDAS